MKGIIGWGVFAAFYLVLVILFQALVVSAQIPNLFGWSPNNGAHETVNNNGVTRPPSPSTTPLPGNSDQAAMFQSWGISDPAVIQAINNVYGSLLGQPECIKKSICVMGNYFHDVPGRDVVFTLLGRWVPPEWGLLYDIFRVSVMYGQDCEAYLCDPQRNVNANQRPGVPIQTTSSTGAPTGTTPMKEVDEQEPTDNQIHKKPFNPAKNF